MGQASRQYIFNYGKIQVDSFDYFLNTCHICLGLLDQMIMRNRMLFFSFLHLGFFKEAVKKNWYFLGLSP